jgi:hypothetical protein
VPAKAGATGRGFSSIAWSAGPFAPSTENSKREQVLVRTQGDEKGRLVAGSARDSGTTGAAFRQSPGAPDPSHLRRKIQKAGRFWFASREAKKADWLRAPQEILAQPAWLFGDRLKRRTRRTFCVLRGFHNGCPVIKCTSSARTIHVRSLSAAGHQRNLIYTGITRGKRLLVLIGQRKALSIAVRNDRPQRWYSGLLASLTNSKRPTSA